METPKKQGYYQVLLAGEPAQKFGAPPHIAAWKELDKKVGKRWYKILDIDNDPTKGKTYEPLDGVISFMAAAQDDVRAVLFIAPTLEQKISASYKSYISSESLWASRTYAVPESRKLHIGQEVELGALTNCKVLALHDDGAVVTLSVVRRNRNVDVNELYTGSWLDMYALSDIQKTALFNSPRYTRVEPSNTALGHLVSRVWRQGLNDHPDYQRGYVWTAEDEQKFLDSVFTGKQLGTYVFLRHKYPKPEEIFDGKQRLQTMIRLVSSQLAYRGYYWHQMSPRDRKEAENRNVSSLTLQGEAFSRAELLQMFLDINSAGVPQSEEHLLKVRELLAEELTKVNKE